MGSAWAIVVAAGTGTRFGRPKQYELLLGRAVLDHSLMTASAVCDGVVAVLPPADVGRRPLGCPCAVVAGGDTRSASVRAGLAAVPDDAEVIVVHDAARPLATVDLWRAVIAAVRDGADGALCAIPVSDTIRRVGAGSVGGGSVSSETLDRSDLVAVQTPQAFAAAALRSAHAAGDDATDDGALVERAGGRVVIVPGSPTNIKITNPHDMIVAAALLGAG